MIGSVFAHACSAASVGGSVTATTDYVYRGVSLTRNEPVVQADLHFQSGDWVLGTWASRVKPQPQRYATELDAYTQWHQPLVGGISASLGATYYSVVDDPRVAPYDYLELSAEFNWRERLVLTTAWAPKNILFSRATGPVSDVQTYTIELTANQALRRRLSFQAGVGYFAVADVFNSGYAYGSGGLARQFGRVQAALSYFWVQDVRHRSFMAGPAGTPWVLTAAWTF